MRCHIVVILLVIVAVAFAEKLHEDDWELYFAKDFSKNELCSTLRCSRHEVCLVKHRRAICIQLNKLDQIDGLKIHHETRESVTADKLRDNLEWDPDQLMAKMEQYRQKIQRKHKAYRSQQENEIHSKHTHTYRHLESDIDDCSEMELRAMGGRLHQWFSDVHKQTVEGVRDVSVLPKHHISCKPDVAWMFTQWDGDDNGELTMEELKSLEGDKYERCIKPFLDRCDDNGDDVLNLDEWCDCFSWVGNERKEPPCHAAAHKVDPHLLGSFRPRCDVDGYYRPLQCHDRQCWCADKYGREFPSSRVIGLKADCGQYAELNDDFDEDLMMDDEGSGKFRTA